MVMQQVFSSTGHKRAIRPISRWMLALAIGGALVSASFGSVAATDAATAASTSTAPAHAHHRRTAASVHAAARLHAHTATLVRHAALRPYTHVLAHADAAASQSVGYAAGLHATEDPLFLRSGAALVLDQDTHEVLYSKNSQAVLPIASLTKLMTAMVISEAHQPLDEKLAITTDDIDTEKNTHSRLVPGTELSRGVMLHLALMSSENRAANALGRNYPGGLAAFVPAMNAKARELGMTDTHYVEPTGLSSHNESSAHDLAVLVNAAHQVPLLREYSTTPSLDVALGSRQVQFHTTDRLVASPAWDIGLQTTGFINEAGQCLVMQVQMAGRKLIMVLLDSAGKYSRIADAERIRKWVTSTHMTTTTTTVRTAVTTSG
jgi:D-alanyl-D-alanine endopeptidase (penicillin-binding protein 7)